MRVFIMKQRFLFVIAVALAAIFAGCVGPVILGWFAESPMRFEDVSQTDEYSPFIGRRYILAADMLVYGVCRPPGYRKMIDEYFMTPDTPGPWGREILSKDRVPAGTVMKILKIQRSIQHIPGLSPTIEAVVQLSDFQLDADIPLTVNWSYISSPGILAASDEGMMVGLKAFEWVEENAVPVCLIEKIKGEMRPAFSSPRETKAVTKKTVLSHIGHSVNMAYPPIRGVQADGYFFLSGGGTTGPVDDFSSGMAVEEMTGKIYFWP